MAHYHLRFYLTDRLDRHAHSNQDGRSGKGNLHVLPYGQQGGNGSQHSQEQTGEEGQAIRSADEVIDRILTGAQAADVAALTLNVFSDLTRG